MHERAMTVQTSPFAGLHLSGYHLGSIKMLFYLTGSSTQEHDAYKQDTVKCKLILSFVTLYQQYHLFKCSTLKL